MYFDINVIKTFKLAEKIITTLGNQKIIDQP